MKTAKPYDAIEGEDFLLLLLEGDTKINAPIVTTVFPGHGIEVRPLGTSICFRFGNLHPRIWTALEIKPLHLGIYDDHKVTILGAKAPDRPTEISTYVPSDFLYMIEAGQITEQQLAQRPLPRILERLDHSLTLIMSGNLEGQPIGLGRRSNSLVTLPRRQWATVRPSLFVEIDFLEGQCYGSTIISDLQESVSLALSDRSPTAKFTGKTTGRKQLAMMIDES